MSASKRELRSLGFFFFLLSLLKYLVNMLLYMLVFISLVAGDLRPLAEG